MSITNRKANSLSRVKLNFDAISNADSGVNTDLIVDFDPSDQPDDGKVYDRPIAHTPAQIRALEHGDKIRAVIDELVRLKYEDLNVWGDLIRSVPAPLAVPEGLHDFGSYKWRKISADRIEWTCATYKVTKTRADLEADPAPALTIVNAMVAQYDADNIAYTSHKRFVADLAGYMRQQILASSGEEGKRMWSRPSKLKLDNVAVAEKKNEVLSMFDAPEAPADPVAATPATATPAPATPAPATPAPKRGKGK